MEPKQNKSFSRNQKDEGDDREAPHHDHREAEDAEVHLGGLEGSHHQGEAEEEAGTRTDTGSESWWQTRPGVNATKLFALVINSTME